MKKILLHMWLKTSNAFVNGRIVTGLALISKKQYEPNLEEKSKTTSIFIDSHPIEKVEDVK